PVRPVSVRLDLWGPGGGFGSANAPHTKKPADRRHPPACRPVENKAPPALTPNGAMASANRRDRVAVLSPSLLVRALRGRTILAVADRAHAVGGDALGLQIGRSSVRAAIAQCEVVLFRAALIAVAGDLHLHAAVLREPGSLLVQGRMRIRAEAGLVEIIEDAIADVGDQVFL